MGAWPYPPWLVSCNKRSVFIPEWTTPQSVLHPNLVACAWPYPPWLVSCIERSVLIPEWTTLQTVLHPNLQACAWPYPPWLVSCNERSVFVPEWTTPQLISMCLTLSPMVSLMYRAKCIHPRMNNSPKFMVVCYSVVWYCMVGDGMVWVLTIDGCFLQMGASHPSVESTHL